jgi:D-alanyl-D-alanine carboxypeptidase
MVVLEQKPDLDRWITISREDWKGVGRTHLRPGERASMRDLLHMALMCSDNCATRALARESGIAPEDFIARMNRKCAELGLEHTRFVEVTGLDEHNVSTAGDCAHMLLAAAKVPTIQDIMQTREWAFSTSRRSINIPNTNRLLYGRYEVLGGKTGFINEAGYCFATWLRTDSRDLVAVVLGAPTAATRFADVMRLVQRTTAPSFAPTDR